MRIVTRAGAVHAITGGSVRRTWCYLGIDLDSRERLRATCGSDPVPVGQELTETAMRLKQPFLDWIAKLGSRQRRPVTWWASALASKSPLQMDLFFLVCYGEAVAAWIDGSPPAEVIVIEDPWLWCCIREWFAGDSRVVFGSEGAGCRMIQRINLRLRTLRATASFTLWAVATWIRARVTWPSSLETLPNRGVVIFSWIEARAFDDNGVFRDPYTGRLASMLRAAGSRVMRLTPLLVARPLWPALQRSEEPFIVTARWVRGWDIVRAAFTRFRIDEVQDHRRFCGRDYMRLLARERLVERASVSYRQQHLWYHIVARIAAAAARTNTTVIYPFENQPHEKLLCLAFRRAAPDARLIGYVMAGIPALLLSFFVGAGEAAFQPLPDRIVTNGPASRDVLAAHGYPLATLVDGGALRFEYLERAASEPERPERVSTTDRVLVPLPSVRLYARALLDDLFAVCREAIVNEATGHTVEFVLTFHVDLPPAAVFRPGERLPTSVSLSAASVSELLPVSRLCLFTPPTGSWREALIGGLPVLRYRPDLLDIDPIDELGGTDVPGCSRANLRQAIVNSLRISAIPSVAARTKLLQRIYSPVQEAVWLSVVGRPSEETQLQ